MDVGRAHTTFAAASEAGGLRNERVGLARQLAAARQLQNVGQDGCSSPAPMLAALQRQPMPRCLLAEDADGGEGLDLKVLTYLWVRHAINDANAQSRTRTTREPAHFLPCG